ncbi:delta-60 repeat domain-containing protein [Prosthecobacter debontii]|uniref:Delta-60 repeat domain-containing protein n=1 Tax=Prosthecobacter debontii TaxID=48467 RepID=A0A1T4YUR5_9BACT|nr:choice-of-anchor D domain-containing protein [Prosthecobacter debontii]SKB05490.1 delta-60 repeat domain-containing protein [Prosthecobacter debontii]
MNTCSSYPSSALRIWLFLFVVFLGGLRAAVPVLDPNFSVGLPAYSTVVTSALQPDGKILVGGPFIYTTNSGTGSGVARLNSNGSLDESFRASISGRVEYLILQEDGKIIAGSQKAVLSVGGGTATHLVRLNSDGSLDSTYAPVFGPANLNSTLLKALALQKDGKLIVGGAFTTVSGAAKTRLARLNTDGTLDTGFSPDPNNTVDSLALKNDQLYVLGYFTQIAGITQSYLARLNLDGSCDTAFLPYVSRKDGMKIESNGDIRIFSKSNAQMYDEVASQYYNIPCMASTRISSVGAILSDGNALYSWWENRSGQMAFGITFNSEQFGPYQGVIYGEAFADGSQDYRLSNYVTAGATMQENNGVLLHVYPSEYSANDTSLIGRVSMPSFSPSLQIDSNGLITWNRSGSLGFPRGDYAKFQVSYDSGLSWSDLGYGTLTNIYGNQWQYSGSVLPDSAIVRTRSPVQGGYLGISQGFSGMQLKVGADVYISSGSESIPDGATSASLAYNTLFDPTLVSPVNAYVTKTYTIRNTGAKDATVSSITVSGTHAADFTVGGLSLPTTVTTSTPKTFTLTFNPSAIGTRTATITVTNSDATKGAYDFVVSGEGVEPEINLKGNDLGIVNGDATPSSSDGTDFGPGIYVPQLVKTFVIENAGTGPLTVSSIGLSGPNASNFSVTQISGGTVAPGQSKSFDVLFYPASPLGAHYATVTINSNDADEAAYTFTVKAEGIEPEINVKGNGVTIVDGDTTPSVSDDTDYGPAVALPERVKTFTIENSGSGPLIISNIALTGVNAADFGVSQITGPILPGESRTFNVTLYPSAPGPRSATIIIYSNDTNEAAYDYAILGQGVEGWQLPSYAVNFSTAQSIPITTSSIVDLSGRELQISLSFAPATGASLKVINNTGLNFISGSYVGMAHGSQVILSYGSLSYVFVANYYGGDGNDLVLQWAGSRPYGWGFNTQGSLGDGVKTNRTTPVATLNTGVLAGKTILSIATGGTHTLALTSEGKVYAWGDNANRQLGNGLTGTPGTTDSASPIAVFDGAGSALADKTVVAIAAGLYHSLALCSDGNVAAWGYNTTGQLGNGTTTATSIPTLVTKATGSALNGKTVVRIASGSGAFHSLALCSDGSLAAWGRNTARCLGSNSATASFSVPQSVNTSTGALAGKTVIGISAGLNFSLALCSDSSIAAWGDNGSRQLGNGLTGTPGSADAYVPINTSLGSLLSGGLTITQIAAGELHGLALRSDGKVISWGANTNGKLGDGTTTATSTPALVNTDSGSSSLYNKTVTAISAGENHSYALCSDGSVHAWGHNNVGQIGQGTTTPATNSLPLVVLAGEMGVSQKHVSTSSGLDHAITLVAEPQAVMAVESPNDVQLSHGQTLDFGQTFFATGVTSYNSGISSQTIRIENHGVGILSGITMSKLNDSSSSYSVSSSLPTALSSGQYGTFVINFNPSAIGTHTAVVRITATVFGIAKNFDLNLTGIGSDSVFSANYVTGSEVPITATSLNASGKSIHINFTGSTAPPVIKVVELTPSSAFIEGFFTDLPDNEIISIVIGGQTYSYIANYYGGTGNDLILERLDFTLSTDGDSDGLTNLHEFRFGTHPQDYTSFTRPVTWSNLNNTVKDDAIGSLTKNGGVAGSWDADGVSQVEFVANGVVVFSVKPESDLAVGLSAANVDRHFSTFTHAIKFSPAGAEVYESGVQKVNLGGYGLKTTFSIRRTGQYVEYLKNRKVIYTSSVASSGEVIVDTSLASLVGGIETAHIVTNDLDEDGLPDFWEKVRTPGGYGWDAVLALLPENDDDEDSLTNLQEYEWDTFPFDSDSDNDGLPDGWEVTYGLNPRNSDENQNGVIDGLDDFDRPDGLSNALEYLHGTHPKNHDTDGDGLLDGWEVMHGLDPLDPDQNGNGMIDSEDNFDSDQLLNFQEHLAGTSPWVADTDEDGVPDHEEFYSAFPASMDADGDGLTDTEEIALGSDPNDWRSTPYIQFQVTTPLR